MANLNQIVESNIALKTAGVPGVDFSITLIAGPALFSERVRIYLDSDSMAKDPALSPGIVLAGEVAFGQEKKPSKVKVGRTAVSSFVLSVPSVVDAGDSFSVTFGAETETVTGETTGTAVMTALALAIGANANMPVTASSSDEKLTLTFKADQMETPTLTGALSYDSYATLDTTEGIKADLLEINEADNGWYALICTSRIEDVVKGAASWVESQGTQEPKIFFFSTAIGGTEDAEDDTDLLSFLKDLGYEKTVSIYDPNYLTEYKEAAWQGLMSTEDPGSSVYGLKKLKGVTPTRISTTIQQAVWGKNANTFEPYAENIVLTNKGQVVSGEWIDIITGRDWLNNEIQRDQVGMMIKAKKIPGSNIGAQMHGTTLMGTLERAKRKNIVAQDEVGADGNLIPGYVIVVPDTTLFSDNEKASREIDITWDGIPSGAYQLAKISGSLAYSR